MNCIAKTMSGLEETLEGELKAIGAKKCKTLRRAVSFEADNRILYKANLHCRTAIRILVQKYSFQAKDARELYDKVKELPWEEHMGLDETLAIDASVNSEFFPHSKYASLKMKDAIVDRFRLKYGRRPDVDPVDADLNLNLFIYEDKVSISIDSSGDSLHRRGYRSSGHLSPLNEVLAAGMLMLSGWDKSQALYDPMCGSGTVPIEAAMIGSNTPPGHLRREFGFMRWKDFDAELWKAIKDESIAAIDTSGFNIRASDISGIHVRMARSASEAAGLDDCISFEKGDFFEQTANEGFVMMNPPYGERMGMNDIEGFYEELADHLKASFTGTQCWLISSNNDALLRFGLRPSKKIVLYNGPLECLFQKFELYPGSKKAKWQEGGIDDAIRKYGDRPKDGEHRASTSEHQSPADRKSESDRRTNRSSSYSERNVPEPKFERKERREYEPKKKFDTGRDRSRSSRDGQDRDSKRSFPNRRESGYNKDRSRDRDEVPRKKLDLSSAKRTKGKKDKD